MNTLAIYAGSFNPIHAGHIAVIETAKHIFGDDMVQIVLADNPQKEYSVPKEKRAQWVQDATWIKPEHTGGFICDYCDELMAMTDVADRIVLIRGVRSAIDLDVEMPMAGYNYNISHGEYPTILIPTNANLRDLSSSAVRVIAKRDFNDFFDALYKPYPPQHISFSKWVDVAEDIWKTYHED